MLDTKKDRLDYGKLLMPPAGYHVVAAIATTYSLDLETLMAATIPLAHHEQHMGSETMKSDIATLEGLKKLQNKILIFVEAGQILKPRRANKLFHLFENQVFPVTLQPDRAKTDIPSFHPKVWLLVYSNGQEKYYRFIVLSRNLTRDRSWDVAVALDGVEVEHANNSKTQPLINFIQFLKEQLPSQNNDAFCLIDQIIVSLQHVEFSLDNRIFTDYEILPLGIGQGSYDMIHDELFSNSYHDLIVISPFISHDIITTLSKPWKQLKDCRFSLLTRETELSKIGQQEGKLVAYTVKENIVNGEEIVSEDNNDDIRQQDIHAKLYYCRKNGTRKLYVGSMNASHRGLNCNVEMMLKLSIKKYLSNDIYNILEQELFASDETSNPLFIKQDLNLVKDPEEASNNIQMAVELIRCLCRCDNTATVESTTSNNYNIHITIDNHGNTTDPFNNLTIKPLFTNEYKPVEQSIWFNNICLSDLSEFYLITATVDDATISRIIKISTTGIPKEERESAIIASIIPSRGHFLELIALILSDSPLATLLEAQIANKSSRNRPTADWAHPAIYETLLKSLPSHHKAQERIKEVRYFIDKLKLAPNSNGTVPQEIENLLKLVENVISK